MKNHAFIFSALFITGALFPLPDFPVKNEIDSLPNPRHLEEVVYDNNNNALYLFGGTERQGEIWIEPDNLFEYSGQWKQRSEKGPQGRRGHALIFDESRQKIVLIGGVAQTRPGSDTVLSDTWTWANGNWKTLDTKCPVKEPRAVYDPDKKRVLVYGDVNNLSKPWRGGDERKYELWQFSSGRWTKLSDKGPNQGPFPLAYNRKNKSLSTLEWIDGTHLILWEWRNDQWRKTEFQRSIPEIRGKYSFTYSKTHNALFLFGGTDSNRDLLGDFWKYDGQAWSKIQDESSPSARASLRLIDAGERLLLYGGVTNEGLTNELWEYKDNRWKKL